MAELVVSNITKRFGEVVALNDVSFRAEDGEFLTLLGPSGCGKSTTLASVAGFETPDSGSIRAGAAVFFDAGKSRALRPEDRNCGLVFQSYALWPHLTVADNVAFPLRVRKMRKPEIRTRVEEVLALVEMAAYAARYPHELSGGQQQRVALARTLVYQPNVLLLDEPLSNLDAKLRERARGWLKALQKRLGLTTLFVTHDQLEALSLSDRIVVMDQGRIAQVGTPQEIFERPANAYVADFIGTRSFLRGRVSRATNGRGAEVELPNGQTVRVPSSATLPAGTSVTLALRPEILRIVPSESARPDGVGTILPTRLVSRSYLGARWSYELAIGDSVARVETTEKFDGDAPLLWIPAEGSILFTAD